MEMKDIWLNFSSRISEIEMVQRAAKATSKRELEELNRQYEILEKNLELKNMSSSLHNMSFNSPFTGSHIFYDFKEKTIRERASDVFLYRNKQYQWLLAEAYEEFEDFLEHAYAYYGKKDIEFWPLNDYGDINLSEIKNKDFNWHLEKAKKKNTKAITATFRKKFKQLKNIEITNSNEINLRMAIVLIEKLRHVIVHNGGKTSKSSQIIDKVMKESEVYKKGKIPEKEFDFANSLFLTNDSHNGLVRLLEVKIKEHFPLDVSYDIFMSLIRYLLSYAYIIYSLIDPNIKSHKNMTKEEL